MGLQPTEASRILARLSTLDNKSRIGLDSPSAVIPWPARVSRYSHGGWQCSPSERLGFFLGLRAASLAKNLLRCLLFKKQIQLLDVERLIDYEGIDGVRGPASDFRHIG